MDKFTDPGRVLIFDTTLRDGEQSPGASLNEAEKIKIAHSLAKLGVDVIEAGFPFSSQGDFNAVNSIAKEVQGPIICGLARATEQDIKKAAQAVEPAPKRRIHTFIGASDIHLEYKLKLTREQCIKKAVQMVQLAKTFTHDIEFSPEDAGRADPKFLFELLFAVIEAGATTVNIPDTVGYITPFEFGGLIKQIKENVPNINKAIISVHCHNDLGLAVANSLAAVQNGARQVECTINGLGERAGNCALEEIVMILKTRKEHLGLYTNINTTEIARTSHLVSNLTGFPVQKNKAIVGANAFAHESGIHQDGVLKHKQTYEIIDPSEVGLKTNKLPLGPRSGKHALKSRLEELGFEMDTNQLDAAYLRFKELADKKKQLSDKDLISIVDEKERESVTDTFFKLERLQIACGTGLPTASVEIRNLKEESLLRTSALGTGPVDAIYQALKELVKIPNELIEFSVHSVTEGIDAQGEVTIRIKYQNKIFSGYSADTDILVASAKAYLNAVNKLCEFLDKIPERGDTQIKAQGEAQDEAQSEAAAV
ncbi:MAG: 2-isopropylmalate synthase [Candidatus Caenarcaniphilales bacterium]|nr:2-isopropylmalate synthase [Candidatus Caenarcaniphilales bacterium]